MRRQPKPNELFAVGIHPASGRELLGEPDKTCGNCEHTWPMSVTKPSEGVKCEAFHRPNPVPTKATWQACKVWQPRKTDVRTHDLTRYEGAW